MFLLAFGLGFIRLMDRNSCNSSFPVLIPFAFLIALLNTSINLSTCPFIFDGEVPILDDLSRVIYRKFQILLM